jgi:hypothetical protein
MYLTKQFIAFLYISNSTHLLYNKYFQIESLYESKENKFRETTQAK